MYIPVSLGIFFLVVEYDPYLSIVTELLRPKKIACAIIQRNKQFQRSTIRYERPNKKKK